MKEICSKCKCEEDDHWMHTFYMGCEFAQEKGKR